MPSGGADAASELCVEAARVLLHVNGIELTEGRRETPRRFASFLREFLNPPGFHFTTFDSEGMSEMVLQRQIHFYALCEHHLLPFFGTAAVAYIPNGRIVGLSKLARAVQTCARSGPQNQERITQQIGALLEAQLHPRGVGVVLEARHLCMEMRGARTFGATTTTSYVSGALRQNHAARAEFLQLAGAR